MVRRPDSVTYCSAEEDARRRDFTINGIFFDPIAERVIDYVDGQADLKRKQIRAIGDPAARIEERQAQDVTRDPFYCPVRLRTGSGNGRGDSSDARSDFGRLSGTDFGGTSEDAFAAESSYGVGVDAATGIRRIDFARDRFAMAEGKVSRRNDQSARNSIDSSIRTRTRIDPSWA